MGDDRTGRSPGGPRAVILMRLLVGLVFFEEGIQKFLFPAVMGTGRFARIGIPAPEVMGPFVGGVEIVCRALPVLGLSDPAVNGSPGRGHHGRDPLDPGPSTACGPPTRLPRPTACGERASARQPRPRRPGTASGTAPRTRGGVLA